MFQNSYQNGTFFEVFDPKTPQDKLKNLYKLQNVQPNFKVFDKNLKTFIYEFLNSTSKITFPKEDKKQLYLIQQYLNLQLEFNDADWHLELAVSDLTRTKRRIIISPSFHKVEKKPFFLKFPCPPLHHGLWTNLCIDLYSFIEGFKGQTYRSLDVIQLIGNIKLRRIYTTQNRISETELENQAHQAIFLPKNFQFPPEIQNSKCYIQFQQHHEQIPQPHPQNYSKSRSNIQSTKNIKRQIGSKKVIKDQRLKKQQPKQAKQEQKYALQEKKVEKESVSRDERKFLANTNGLETLKMNKHNKNQECEDTSKSIIAPLSTGKVLKKKREPLSKTQIQKVKRSSIQNKGKVNQKQKSPKKLPNQEKEKLNPWRSSTSKKHETGRVELEKIQDERKIESAQATLFKTRNNLVDKQSELRGKQFDRNSDHSRESDYFQLSQKFSTVTETRFFKNEVGSKKWQQEAKKEAHDQIEQNIQVQTNSYYSSSPNIKNKQNLCIEVNQSINDSLDDMASKNKKTKQPQQLIENDSYFNMSSRMGFGEKMMNKYMKQLERPYSPPLGERQHTQEQQLDVVEGGEGKGVELIYDPVLNCYYDHKTHTYYELKN